LTCVAVLVHVDNAVVLKVLQNGDFVVNGKDGVCVATKELFLEDLDSSELLSADAFAKVDLGGVALAEGLENLELSIEDRVSLSVIAGVHCNFVFSSF